MAKLEIILSELKGHISFIEMGDEHSNAENEYFQMIDDCIEEAKVEAKELKAECKKRGVKIGSLYAEMHNTVNQVLDSNKQSANRLIALKKFNDKRMELLKADADAFEKKLVEHDDTIKRLSDELSKYKKSKIVKLMWWLK